jgi:hypothetical protein
MLGRDGARVNHKKSICPLDMVRDKPYIRNMQTGLPPPHPPPSDRPPSRTPVMMSALGYPGAGQFMQKRWLAGLLYGLAFTAGFVAFAVYMFRIIAAFYSLGLDFENAAPPAHLPVRGAVFSLAAALAVYAAALADTYAAYRRACTTWARRKLPRG